MEKIKVCSLFSGIGGFETGLFRAVGAEKIDLVMASEIDKTASFAYRHLYNHAIQGDVKKIEAHNVPEHDLLVAGFPCQSFSVAGARKGFKDIRGTLFFDIARIAKEKKPKHLLLENVKGLVNHDDGETLKTILKTLSRCGYTVDFEVLNSKYFGLPQNRERIFIIAKRDEPSEPWHLSKTIGGKAKKHLAGESDIRPFNFDFPKGDNTATTIHSFLEVSPSSKYHLSTKKEKQIISQMNLPCFHQTSTFLVDDQGRRKKKLNPLHVSPTIRKEMHGNEPRVVRHAKGALRVRRMTPKECLRVQGFPDIFHDQMKKIGISDTQMYKMAGNAVSTNVIKAIVKKMYPNHT